LSAATGTADGVAAFERSEKVERRSGGSTLSPLAQARLRGGGKVGGRRWPIDTNRLSFNAKARRCKVREALELDLLFSGFAPWRLCVKI